MNAQTLKIVLLAAYGAASLVNLGAILAGVSAAQSASKLCLMPLLALYYFVCGKTGLPFHATALIAILAGWAGDAFLIKGGTGATFYLGMVSFLAGHVLYITTIGRMLPRFDLLLFSASLFVMLLVVALVFRLVSPPPAMAIPLLAYALALALLAVFAAQSLSVNPLAGGLLLAGSLLFLASDSMLAYFLFHQNSRPGNFAVMLTYILAQALLVQGFIRT